MTYVELAPAFSGDAILQERFLAEVGIFWPVTWRRQDTLQAHSFWAARIAEKRSGHSSRRPIADVLIEAFAARFEGLITRNPKHFTSVRVVVP